MGVSDSLLYISQGHLVLNIYSTYVGASWARDAFMKMLKKPKIE